MGSYPTQREGQTSSTNCHNGPSTESQKDGVVPNGLRLAQFGSADTDVKTPSEYSSVSSLGYRVYAEKILYQLLLLNRILGLGLPIPRKKLGLGDLGRRHMRD